jgi:hypothetical protein
VIKERESGDRRLYAVSFDNLGQIGRVQLTLNAGSQVEDDGISDASLFIGGHGEPPRTVHIYAPDGCAALKPHHGNW